MGLDSVELVIRLEETFGVTMLDVEAQQIVTVGDAYALLAGKTSTQRRDTCLSAAAFYRMRRALCELLLVDRSDVRPATRLRGLIPRQCRRQVWRGLQDRSGLRLPGLARPKWLGAALVFAATTSVSVSAFVNRLPLGQLGLLLHALCGVALVAVAIVFLLTLPLAIHLPGSRSTVGQVAQLLAINNQTVLLSHARGWTHGELWETLQSVIVEQLGVERSQITPKTRLLDLGLS